MKGIPVGFAALASHFFLLTAGATTIAGKVTDATTGHPIPAATVFVYWGHMVHPHSLSPVVVANDWWSCDGTAVAVSDAAGRYEIDLPVIASLHKSGDRAPQIRVVAPGYFDDHVFYEQSYRDAVMRSIPMRKHTDGENRWSPSLIPFGDLGLDARVAALDLETTEYSIGAQEGYVCENSSAHATYRAAIAHARADALCTNAIGLDPPHAGTLQVSLRFARPDLPEPSRQRYAFLYRELIQPLVPADPQAVAPNEAYANACAWVRWQQAASDSAASGPDDPITLSIPIVDANDRQPLAHVPVRILWGRPSELYAPANGYFSARRGFVAKTGDDGRARVPITRAMIDEQKLDFAAYTEQLRYAAVPITFDHANFASGPLSNDYGLDARSILDRYTDHVDRVRAADQIERVSDAEWMSLVNLGDASFARYPLNAPEVWRPPAAARAWFELRTREEARQTEATRHPRDMAIPTYPWDWPGLALLWRSTALIAGPVAIESDQDRLAELGRAQFIATFDRLCHEPFQGLSPHETWQALQGLWWLEAQSLGRPVADEHAQRRAVAWDHGIRCVYQGSQLIQRGPSPSVFDTREFCAAWTAERRPIIEGSRGPPPKLDALTLEFSRREKACTDAPNGGAFQ